MSAFSCNSKVNNETAIAVYAKPGWNPLAFAGYAMQIVYNAHDYAKITMFRNIIMNKLIKPYDGYTKLKNNTFCNKY